MKFGSFIFTGSNEKHSFSVRTCVLYYVRVCTGESEYRATKKQNRKYIYYNFMLVKIQEFYIALYT